MSTVSTLSGDICDTEHIHVGPIVGDITRLDTFKDFDPELDMLVGGPPCPPFSKAGKGGWIAEHTHTHTIRPNTSYSPSVLLVPAVGS